MRGLWLMVGVSLGLVLGIRFSGWEELYFLGVLGEGVYIVFF